MNYTQLYNKLKSLLSEGEIALFAKPDVLPDFTSWSVAAPERSVISEFSTLSDIQREDLADRIELTKNTITRKLAGVKEFESLLGALFIVPAESNIKAVVAGESVYAVFTQWACTSAITKSTIDPLSTFLMRPRANSDQVTLEAVYHTGEAAAEKEFYLEYSGRQSREKTDAGGFYNRGRCRLGSQFAVYDERDGSTHLIQSFVVSKGNNYKVIFPLFTGAVIKVIDQDDLPISGETIRIIADRHTNLQAADTEGCIGIKYLKVGEEFSLQDPVNESAVQVFKPEKGDNQFIFRVQRSYQSSCTIRVVDANRQPVHKCRILINSDDMKREFVPGSDGIVIAGKYPVGSKLKVSNADNHANSMEFSVSKTDNEFVFVLEQVPEKFVTVKFVDRKKKPMTGVKIDFTYGGKTQTLETDSNGLCTLPYSGFSHKEKVETFIHLAGKENKKKE